MILQSVLVSLGKFGVCQEHRRPKHRKLAACLENLGSVNPALATSAQYVRTVDEQMPHLLRREPLQEQAHLRFQVTLEAVAENVGPSRDHFGNLSVRQP